MLPVLRADRIGLVFTHKNVACVQTSPPPSGKNRRGFFTEGRGDVCTQANKNGDFGEISLKKGSCVAPNSKGESHIGYLLERFSDDLEMKAREQNRNDKRTEIERFDWFIERTDKRVWLFIG